MKKFLFKLIKLTAVIGLPCILNAQNLKLKDDIESSRWFTLNGESRLRYENLNGQFRTNNNINDELILLRTLLKFESDLDGILIGAELQDSRTYIGSPFTPLSNSFTNPLDILQLYAKFVDLPFINSYYSTSQLNIGRQTISIGSKRQIERVSFANVIKSYTGVYFKTEFKNLDELHLFGVVPVKRYPDEFNEIKSNKIVPDQEQWGRRIWGLHYRRSNILSNISTDLWGELFIYGLNEIDTSKFQTPNRDQISPGFRLYREPNIGDWDIDIEAAIRRGTRYLTMNANDTMSLKIKSDMIIGVLGYTFSCQWNPRLSVEYYYSSGDEDPDDYIFGQHERLFGGRRTDLNNTSIHGPLTPANLSAPGIRVQVKPNAYWDGWLQYHAAYLASETDSWVIPKLQDITGQSGTFIGHAIDTRFRHWIIPDCLQIELGASGLIYGHFIDNVPNGPSGNKSIFGYTQLKYIF